MKEAVRLANLELWREAAGYMGSHQHILLRERVKNFQGPAEREKDPSLVLIPGLGGYNTKVPNRGGTCVEGVVTWPKTLGEAPGVWWTSEKKDVHED